MSAEKPKLCSEPSRSGDLADLRGSQRAGVMITYRDAIRVLDTM
jgi:hypothetical protein